MMRVFIYGYMDEILVEQYNKMLKYIVFVV